MLKRLPAQVQRSAYSGGLPVTAENDQLYKDSYRAMLAMTKRMYDAGIPILAGTDSIAGLMLHRELELEVQAGIPPAKSLQIATWNAAKLLKQEKDSGIDRGRQARRLSIGGGKSRGAHQRHPPLPRRDERRRALQQWRRVRRSGDSAGRVGPSCGLGSACCRQRRTYVG